MLPYKAHVHHSMFVPSLDKNFIHFKCSYNLTVVINLQLTVFFSIFFSSPLLFVLFLEVLGLIMINSLLSKSSCERQIEQKFQIFF